jgi:5'-nucleotidase
MHILVTNDDGVTAPGLAALATALRELGRVTIMAPDKNWSASGHVKTMHKPLRVSTVHLADGSEALATSGAPSDCVALALLGIVKKPIDLVVSGINPFSNLGHDVTYSGTVTAAMEATIFGVPGIAVSTDFSPSIGYEDPARIAARIVAQVMAHGLPKGTLLNVNIPGLPEAEVRGVRITRQGLRVYRDELVERADPRGRSYYWIGGDAPTSFPEPGTDVQALADGYVSVTPLHLDLTAYAAMPAIEAWQLDLGAR